MESQKFIHKETGEIATQIPIMEIAMWEEYYQCSCGKQMAQYSTYCLECQEKRFQSGEMESVSIKTMGQKV